MASDDRRHVGALMRQRVVAAILGAGLVVTAVIMLIDPLLWYERLPGVAASGSFNAHFARDLGCANLVAGIVLVAHGFEVDVGAAALLAVAGFICLHAGVHLWELLATSHDAGDRVLTDFGSVYLPAALSAWIARSRIADGSSRVQR